MCYVRLELNAHNFNDERLYIVNNILVIEIIELPYKIPDTIRVK